MSLIYCKACGKQISANAKTCPSCGEPQKAGGNNFFLKILIVLAIAIGGFMAFKMYTSNSEGSSGNETEQKKAIVQEILGKDCTFLSQACTEYIKSGLLADVIAAIATNRCNCVQEVIIPKMIDN